jgi:hypothetical protein
VAETDPLPEAVRTLLAERLDSIAQLELLLLLHRTAPEAWQAAMLAAELRLETAWTQRQLVQLRDAGLLVEDPPGSGTFRFEAADVALGKAVEALAICYAERRVTVVSLLYSRPRDPIRVFADAFRIRREDDDG